jgi:hypothetical protein
MVLVSVSVRKVSVLELGLVQNLREGELLVLELTSELASGAGVGVGKLEEAVCPLASRSTAPDN